MDRTTMRAAIVATLQGLLKDDDTPLFAAVLPGRHDKFGGKTPIAVVSGTGMLGGLMTHGNIIEVASAVTISIYVQRPAGSESATEDALDRLVTAAIVGILQAGDFVTGQSDASGPNRIIDGFEYRVERIPVTLTKNATV